MLVESYAMESTWLLIVALYFGLRFPEGLFFCQTKTYIEVSPSCEVSINSGSRTTSR
jgi:hypothetical protein